MVKNKLFTKLGVLGIGLLASAMIVTGSANVVDAKNTKEASAETVGSFYRIGYDDAADELSLMLSANPHDYTGVGRADLRNIITGVKDNLVAAVKKDITVEANKTSALISNETLSSIYGLTWNNDLETVAPTKASTKTTVHAPGLAVLCALADLDNANCLDVDRMYDCFSSTDNAFSEWVMIYTLEANLGSGNKSDSSLVDIKDSIDRTFNYQYNANSIIRKVGAAITSTYSTLGLGSTTEIEGLFTSWLSAMSTKTQALVSYNGAASPKAYTRDYTVDEVINFVSYTALCQSNYFALFGEEYPCSEYLAAALKGNAASDEAFKNRLIAPLYSGDPAIVKKYLSMPETLTLAKILDTIGADKDDALQALNTIGADGIIAVANEIDNVEELKEALRSFDNFTSADLQDVIEQYMPQFTIREIISTISDVSIGGYDVMVGKQLKKAAAIDFIRSLPRPGDLKNRTDANMNQTWAISVKTSLGTFGFDLKVGFYGDCSYIRLAMEKIDGIFDIGYENGTIKVTVDAGNKLAKLLKGLSNSNSIPNTLKVKVFKFFSMTFEEMNEYLQNLLLQEVIADLKGIDYETIIASLMSADRMNEIFGTDKFTDERLDKLVDAFAKILHLGTKVSFERVKSILEKAMDLDASEEARLRNYYDKIVELLQKIDNKEIDSELLRELVAPENAGTTNDRIDNFIERLGTSYSYLYEKLQNLIQRVYDKMPERMKQKSLLDYYDGNGSFSAAGTFNINLESALSAISSTYGAKVYDKIETLVDDVPDHISLDVTFKANDFYTVTYKYSATEEFTGFLPTGADVVLYADRAEINELAVIKWVDEAGEEVTKMPARDVVLTPVLTFAVTPCEDLIKTYDQQAEDIYVSVDDELAYTYQWYKDGEIINGATDINLSVKVCADSGEYTCQVTRIADGHMVESAPIKVEIAIWEIDVSGVRWQTTDEYTYNGTDYRVQIDRTTLPENVYCVYDGQFKEMNAGDYTAKVKLVVIDFNITLVGQTELTFDWTINRLEIKKPLRLLGDSYIYNGQPITYLVGAKDGYTVTGNTGTNAGTYTAVYSLIDTKNTCWVGGDIDDVELMWAIQKLHISFEFLTIEEDQFVYNGSEQHVALKDMPELQYVDVVATGDKQTNAGDYTVGYQLTVKNPDNVEIIGDDYYEFDWAIAKASVYCSNLAWTYSGPFVYSGDQYGVQIRNLPTTLLSVAYSGVCQATDAGTYQAIATFTVVNPNFEIADVDGLVLDWTIEQAKIYTDGLQWNIDLIGYYTYDGTFKYAQIMPDQVAEGLDLTYGGDYYASKVGVYEAYVIFAAANDNYVIVGPSYSICTWAINYATYKINEVEWSYTGAYTYDGDYHTAVITKINGIAVEELESIFSIEYYGDTKAYRAGEYYALAYVTILNENYVLAGDEYFDCDWVILQKAVYTASVAWDYTTAFTYNGAARTVDINYDTLPLELTYKLSGTTTATNAGSYIAQATLQLKDDENYMMVGSAVMVLNWKIDKAQISVADAQWNYERAYRWDRKEHSVQIEAGSYADQLEIAYGGTTSSKLPGTYKATATFSVKAAYVANYVIVGTNVKSLSWEIYKPATMDAYQVANGEVDTFEGIEPLYTLAIDELDMANAPAVENGKVVAYYDVYFKDSTGKRVDVNVDATGAVVDNEAAYVVRFNIADNLLEKAAGLVIYDANGAAVRLESSIDEDQVLATNVRLGKFAVVLEPIAEDAPWFVLPFSLAGVGVLAVLGYFIVVMRKREIA